MKDFEALKSIWHDQVALPEVSDEDVLKQVHTTRRRFSNKLLAEVIAMAVAVGVLGYVWLITPFNLWTTHLAMLIFMMCCVFYLFVQVKDYRRINNSGLLLNKPEEYINYLKQYRKDRYVLNTQKYRIYTTFLGIGFVLYFIEIFFIASIWVTVAGLVFTVIWFIICHFLFMRNYIKKEEAKLQEMIQNLERLQKQFTSSQLS